TPTNGSPILYTVTFSEAVSGLSGSDVSFAGSTVGGTLVASVSGSGASYTVSVTGMNGDGTLHVAIPAGSVIDKANNINFVSNTDTGVVFDNVAPTVTSITKAGGQADPTNGSPIVFNVQFSEAVTGFTGFDVSFAGSTLGGLSANVSGSGANYTVTVTGMNGDGSVVISVPANSVVDKANNFNLASGTATVVFDNIAPTITSITKA